jgi:DNA repair exonuclease SbcCD ATPase subunit
MTWKTVCRSDTAGQIVVLLLESLSNSRQKNWKSPQNKLEELTEELEEHTEELEEHTEELEEHIEELEELTEELEELTEEFEELTEELIPVKELMYRTVAWFYTVELLSEKKG